MVTPIAKTNFRGQERAFGIKPDDRRRHMYIIGKTGMGKTVFLQNMTIADIEAGHGLAVIDPHGEYAEELLEHIPSHRVNDVVYFNPSDLDYPIAFNAIEKVAPENRHLVASGLMGVFKKIWPDVWSARMEYILNNTILALLEYPNSTLLGIMRMLSNKEYRKKVLEKVTDPVIKAFWLEEYAQYSDKFEKEAIAPIQNKVGQFIAAPIIRNIIGQINSAVNMREIMDTGKILIINLSKGKIGEDSSKLLGGMLVTKLQLAAMSRVDIPEQERRDFYLYVDEFQNFATDSFADILSEARKYRLNLIMAHQYITQLSEEVRDAVFGNVGTLVSFRVGAEDAEFLEKEFTPDFLASDLINLAKTNIYLRLMIDGVASRPFSATTLPPRPRPAKNNKEAIVRVSRERYAKDRKEVEEKISRWASFGGSARPQQAGGTQKSSMPYQQSRQENAISYKKPQIKESMDKKFPPTVQNKPIQKDSGEIPKANVAKELGARQVFSGNDQPARPALPTGRQAGGKFNQPETGRISKKGEEERNEAMGNEKWSGLKKEFQGNTSASRGPAPKDERNSGKQAKQNEGEKIETISLKEALLEKGTTSFGQKPVKKEVDRNNLKKLIEESLDELEKEKRKTNQNFKQPAPFVAPDENNNPNTINDHKKTDQIILKPGQKIYFNQKKRI